MHLTPARTGSDLVSSQVISILRQQVGHFLHVDSIIKWCGVSNFTFICRHLKEIGKYFISNRIKVSIKRGVERTPE